MSSLPERRPIIRGEHVFLRASERGEHHDAHIMSLLRHEWSLLPHRRSWDYA